MLTVQMSLNLNVLNYDVQKLEIITGYFLENENQVTSKIVRYSRTEFSRCECSKIVGTVEETGCNTHLSMMASIELL